MQNKSQNDISRWEERSKEALKYQLQNNLNTITKIQIQKKNYGRKLCTFLIHTHKKNKNRIKRFIIKIWEDSLINPITIHKKLNKYKNSILSNYILFPYENYPNHFIFNCHKYHIIKYKFLIGISLEDIPKIAIKFNHLILKKNNKFDSPSRRTIKYQKLINKKLFPRIILTAYVMIKFFNFIDFDHSPDNFIVQGIDLNDKFDDIYNKIINNSNKLLIKIDHESVIKYKKFENIYENLPTKKAFLPPEMTINTEKVIVYTLGRIYVYLYYGQFSENYGNKWIPIGDGHSGWTTKYISNSLVLFNFTNNTKNVKRLLN